MQIDAEDLNTLVQSSLSPWKAVTADRISCGMRARDWRYDLKRYGIKISHNAPHPMFSTRYSVMCRKSCGREIDSR